uniref:Uncharacterized protein n=1 Tax=Panagrolaimus sp. JU765 TaxID=591449 RepID=A0AC34PVF9_9BILA
MLDDVTKVNTTVGFNSTVDLPINVNGTNGTAFNMVKINSTYHLMFCFIKGIDIHCGIFQKDKFYINEKFEECAFKTEGDQTTHLVIGQRTETKQTIFFEIVEEGKPRRIRKCVAPIKGGQSSVDPFKACDYADYDPVKEDPFNCIFRGKMNKLKDQQIITFDERSWILNKESTLFSNKGKVAVNVRKFNEYQSDYAFALDLDEVRIAAVIPRLFGVKLKDDGCGLEYYQAPSKEVFTSVNFPSPCLPKTDYNYYFLRKQDLNSDDMNSTGNVFLNYLHACEFKPENHSMFCFIVGPKIYEMEYIDLGKRIEDGNESFIKIDDGNITNVMFSADREIFYFMGTYKGFVDDGNGDTKDATECDGKEKCKLTSWNISSDTSCNMSATQFKACKHWLLQFDCGRLFSIGKSKNGTFYFADEVVEFREKFNFQLNYDYIFVDDYSGNKIYFPPKPKFFCFRVTFILLMATLAMDGFLILLFGILFVLEIRGFRMKSYHDIRLELMLQKFAILKAAGRC